MDKTFQAEPEINLKGLKNEKRWLIWRYEKYEDEVEPCKVPYVIHSGENRYRKFNMYLRYNRTPRHKGFLKTYDDLINILETDECLKSKSFSVGIDLGDGLVGIDFDDVLDKQGSLIDDTLYRWIVKLNTYTEISPSGEGLKLLLRSDIDTSEFNHTCYLDKGIKLEQYTRERYFAFTGDVFDGLSVLREDEEGDNVLLEFINEYFERKSENKKNWPVITVTKRRQTQFGEFTAEELDEKIRKSRNGDKYITLMEGDISDYVGASEARRALIAMLLFYTDDVDVIEEVMRMGNIEDASDNHKFDDPHGGTSFIQYEIERAREAYNGAYYTGDFKDKNENKKSQRRRHRVESVDFTDAVENYLQDDKTMQVLLSKVYRPRRHDGVSVNLEPVLWVDGLSVLSRQSIGLVIGEPGAGKSRIIEALVESTVSQMSRLPIYLDESIKKVLWIDTERSSVRLKQGYLRILNSLGITEGDLPYEIECIGLVDIEKAEEKFALIQYFAEQQNYDCILLDMVTDVVNNENSFEEATYCFNALKRIVNQINNAVLITIHNVFKSDNGFGRGVIGSRAQQKCEYVAKISAIKKQGDEKVDDDEETKEPLYYKFKTTKSSESGSPEFYYAWDDEQKNFVQYYPLKRSVGRPTNIDETVNLLLDMFDYNPDKIMLRQECLDWIRNNTEFKDPISWLKRVREKSLIINEQQTRPAKYRINEKNTEIAENLE